MCARKTTPKSLSVLNLFHEPVKSWFAEHFSGPTRAQELGWPVIQSGKHAFILAPTGSGKTLAAFLTAIDHVMFSPLPQRLERCRVLYISPLKALAVDVERNLRTPVAGISIKAEDLAVPFINPAISIRTGDTTSRERAQFNRTPSDILITTPESLYLMLTSNARDALRSVQWVIVDEIHTMVSTKRGAHLALSLERLEAITQVPFQRIGLSATQRPLEEVSAFLGGGTIEKGKWNPREVVIVDAGHKKDLDIQVSVPVEDMSRIGEILERVPKGPAAQGVSRRSLWPSMYPKLLDLIRKHRTTLMFVNNRRLAERIASALNELAGDELVRAHHGSVSREQRMEIEEDLKNGRIPAIVATSSLELGIDMGSIDLVVQIESTPSVASGLQRIGRAGHQAGAASKGIIFPKYRGDLVACAALTKQMLNGDVEHTHYLRNPLDILAQQIVAMSSMDLWNLDKLENVIRGAAPFAELPRPLLESVLEMLSGRFPSDDFADLRPRIVWDRIEGTIRARQGAKSIAIANGGTIPDRGLYGVFLAGSDPGKGRVGELDEEMVFETREGETFLLGSSTWRIEDITHDRVIVSPAPGQPGKMPFWKGEGGGRSIEFGRAVGRLIRKLKGLNPPEARQLLMDTHRLDDWAAENLISYLKEQQEKAAAVPDDKTIVVERYTDELGDWRICILSPFGARIHAPWTHAIEAMVKSAAENDVETMWGDDGIVIRFSETDDPPPVELFLPDPDEVESLVIQQMGASALFASRFRESAGRALLLPRRYPGQRVPLWQQRRRASDLLQITSRFQDFPIILETYRELLKDYFDMPGLVEILREIRSKEIRVVTVNTKTPSPFASSLMFGYVGNFMYEGDAPLAERRAHALTIDQSRLRELLGEAELRELLDADAIDSIELQLQHLDADHSVKHSDGLHELLLRVGDLSTPELEARSANRSDVAAWVDQLHGERRIIELRISGENRWVAAEDAAKYRDGLGASLPAGLPTAFLEPVATPLSDLIARYARTHGPFHSEEPAKRFGLGLDAVEMVLTGLESSAKVVHGEFRPGESGQEWCDLGVLRTIRVRSLAKLRKEIEPVEPAAYGRFLPLWHGIGSDRKGQHALLEVIEQIQGYPIPASILEKQVLADRVRSYDPRDLDSLLSAGAIVWSGVESLGQSDGRIALYVSEHAPKLIRPQNDKKPDDDLHQLIRNYLANSGASFFPQIIAACGTAFKGDVVRALWDLVWAGEVTNDTFLPVRALISSGRSKKRKRSRPAPSIQTTVPLEAAGRWSLLNKIMTPGVSPTEQLTATARQLLERFGVLTREAIGAEKIAGGFAAIYPLLKALEESGKIRRGYFVAGRGAAQFASGGALDRLRSLRNSDDEKPALLLAAADPANPYGGTLPWPERSDSFQTGRFAGAHVVLLGGELTAYLGKGERNLLTFLNPEDPILEKKMDQISAALANEVESGKRRALLISAVDGNPPEQTSFAGSLKRYGFMPYSHGWQKRKKTMD